ASTTPTIAPPAWFRPHCDLPSHPTRRSSDLMSMSSQQKRFTEEFKIEAVRQITERGHRVADVAQRLGVSAHSLYQWRKRYGQADGLSLRRKADQSTEVRKLKAELRRVTEERDILKKAAAYFAKQSQ